MIPLSPVKNLSLFQLGRLEGPRLLEEGRLLQHVHAPEAHQRLLRFGVEYSIYDLHKIVVLCISLLPHLIFSM